MRLKSFLRPIARVMLSDDVQIRFTLDDEELVVELIEYIIRDSTWYIRLRRKKPDGEGRKG